jgi:hypothetical protein
MSFTNATEIHRKSSVAKWTDLLFTPPTTTADESRFAPSSSDWPKAACRQASLLAPGHGCGTCRSACLDLTVGHDWSSNTLRVATRSLLTQSTVDPRCMW